MPLKNRYAIISVDTEALPKRAAGDHVKRLIWGCHDNGTAGIREICSVADEINVKPVFFVDACASHFYPEEIDAVIRWLDGAGHDVQLHTHSEYLPEDFWLRHGFSYRPRFLNQYEMEKAKFVISYFAKVITDLTGKPIRAFRAGSFRWNASTIHALKAAKIPLSFNNSMKAFARGVCTYSEPTNNVYQWSNGVIEVPVTEQPIIPSLVKNWWGRLQFPLPGVTENPFQRDLKPFTKGDSPLLVALLHSWSLLHWDANGHAVYRGEKRIEEFRRLMKKLAKDYDIIDTADFMDLLARGKITPSHSVRVHSAQIKSVNQGADRFRKQSR